jgi:DNA-binding phage protein
MTDETDHGAAIRAARAAYDQARAALFAAIRDALAADVGPNAIARDSQFSREYIARIRDGKGPKGV